MALCLKKLTINKHSGQALLTNFDLCIEKGEILCLMGPSGCGKSTLLSVIAGHLSNEFSFEGEVHLDDGNITQLPAHQRSVGVLFQDDLLFPHLTVWQNLAFALPNEIRGRQRKEQALASLSNVNLQSLANSYPDQISGGQRARVSLLRMLLAKPKVALLDEPFSKLDKSLRKQFRTWVFEQLVQANIPALLVTHDSDDAPNKDAIFHWPKEQNHVG